MNDATDGSSGIGLWAGVAALFVGGIALLARGRSAHASELPRQPMAQPMPATDPKPLGRASVSVAAPYVPAPFVYPPPAPVAPPQQPRGRAMPFSVSTWEPIVGVLAPQAIIPIPFVMAWIEKESGGNPCAVGELTSTGPDGSPREIGLFQIFNPDDFKALGASPSDFVAYCVRPAVGPRQRPDKNNNDGGYLDGTAPNPQRLSRPMTSDEMVAAVAAGIAEIRKKRVYAEHYLGATNTRWNAGGPMAPDYWSTVKLAHALPSILSSGLAQVTHALGRAPATWHEFRAAYETIQPRAKYNSAVDRDHQDGYWKALQNAEDTGFSVPPQGIPKIA